MNNDVKEILAYFEEYVKTTDMHDSEPMLNWKDLKIVLDYITDLQEELEEEKRIEQEDLKAIMNLEEENQQLKELTKDKSYCENCEFKKDNGMYEDIIDKAIEYNYELQERYCHSALFDELVASKVYEISERNINILQGEDNE